MNSVLQEVIAKELVTNAVAKVYKEKKPFTVENILNKMVEVSPEDKETYSVCSTMLVIAFNIPAAFIMAKLADVKDSDNQELEILKDYCTEKNMSYFKNRLDMGEPQDDECPESLVAVTRRKIADADSN